MQANGKNKPQLAQPFRESQADLNNGKAYLIFSLFFYLTIRRTPNGHIETRFRRTSS